MGYAKFIVRNRSLRPLHESVTKEKYGKITLIKAGNETNLATACRVYTFNERVIRTQD